MNLTAMLVMLFTSIVPNNYSGEWKIQPAELVEWQVGDKMEYDLKVSFMSGTAVRSVASETVVNDQNAIWVNSDVKMMGQSQTIEQLIRRSDAVLLKLIVNGEEKPLPDQGEVEIVDQDYKQVTVPAGTFDSVWMKIDTKETKGLETWFNPKDTVMDGILKVITPTQFGKATMELTSFHKVQ